MRKCWAALPLLLLGACETTPRAEPYAPVASVHYSAIGQQPFWLLTIGEDRIVLRQGSEGGEINESVWPRTLPRTVDGTTLWQSGEGTQVIAIASRRGPCTGSAGRVYEDEVRVRLSGVELRGCGGRMLGPQPG